MPIRRISAQYIPLSDIKVGPRLRTEDETYRKHVEDIAESLTIMGPIQPVVLDEHNNLIAGRCRLAAYKLLQEEEVPFVRVENNLVKGDLLMMEVEENIRRKRMNWRDTCIGIAKVHHEHTQTAEKNKETWGLRATGSLLKVSHEHVKTALIIAKLLHAGDAEITAAPSMDKAMDIVLKRKEAAAVEKLAKISTGATTLLPSTKPELKGRQGSGIVNIQLGAPGVLIEKMAPRQVEMSSAYTKINISDRLHNVDCTDFMLNTMSPESVDLIVTDIPYGIDMDNLEGMHGVEDMVSTHEVEQNVEQMRPFLEGSFRVLKQNTYLFFFYALQHHEKLRDWGKEVGFQVQDWPLLWLKPHSCKNNAPHCNYTKSFEPVMVMRKGKPRLASPVNKCHKEVDAMPEKKSQSNPFLKPLEFLVDMILNPVAFPGMVLLDPFAGEGSILKAGILKGCQIIGCEIDKDRFPRLRQNIEGTYRNMLGKNVNFE